jgi:hypothetical protein
MSYQISVLIFFCPLWAALVHRPSCAALAQSCCSTCWLQRSRKGQKKSVIDLPLREIAFLKRVTQKEKFGQFSTP